MKMSQFYAIAPTLYKAGLSVHLEGASGTGKTEGLLAVGEVIKRALGLPAFEVHLKNANSMSSCDVGGYTLPTKDADGDLVTVNSRSPILPSKHAAGHGIVIMDEASQNDSDMRKVLADFYLAGRAGNGGKLPEGWLAWSTGNRVSDKSGVTKALGHETNRRVIIQLDFSVTDWVDLYARPHNIHPLFISAAQFMPDLLVEWDTAIAAGKPLTGSDPFCTPRSYTRFHDFCQLHTGGNITNALATDALVAEVGAGMIGKVAVSKLLGFLRVEELLPSVAAVLTNPEGEAAKLPKERLDVMFAAVNFALSNSTDGTVDEWFRFIKGMPAEQVTSAVIDLRKKHKGVAVNNPGIQQWIAQNPVLISATLG